MGIVTEIRNNILTRVGNTLGSTYQKLSFVNDVSQNTFTGSSKRYGVKVGSASETDGRVGAYTLDHSFSIVLVSSYHSPTNQLNDDLASELAVTLNDLAHTIYKDLATNKSTLSSSGNILIVNNLSINEIEYLTTDKVGVLEFEINIKYKQ